MKLLFDFLPILLFVIAYYSYDFYVATAVLIVASTLQVGWIWFRYRRVEKMYLVMFVLVVVFGGATLLFHNEDFLKSKPTIVNWLFALAFLGSQFIGNKNLLQRMLENQITVDSPNVWLHLNLIWISFFTLMGVINLYVATYFSTDSWVNFKLFGMLGLTVIFIIAQSIYLAQHIVTVEKPSEESTQSNQQSTSDSQA